MLPFKRRQEASVSVPEESVLRKPDNEADVDPMHIAAEELLSAINSKSIKSIAEALRSAFIICESLPHEENNDQSGEM